MLVMNPMLTGPRKIVQTIVDIAVCIDLFKKDPLYHRLIDIFRLYVLSHNILVIWR